VDAETVAVLAEHKRRCEEHAAAPGLKLPPQAYVFSPHPQGRTFLIPDTVTQRYARLAARLGITSHLHALRHYSATELIAAGVDVRTVAGRLGHGGGGATTLRVYAAWLTEADQRAATVLSARMPARPNAIATQNSRSSTTEGTDAVTAPVVPVPRSPRRTAAPASVKEGAYAKWRATQAAGEMQTGAEIARDAGVDASVGRRWRREWLSQ
jgi:hypothetical protein